MWLLKAAKFYRRWYGGVGGGGGAQTLPPTLQKSVKFRNLPSYIFTCWRRFTFKFATFTNFKALFPVVSTVFP